MTVSEPGLIRLWDPAEHAVHCAILAPHACVHRIRIQYAVWISVDPPAETAVAQSKPMQMTQLRLSLSATHRYKLATWQAHSCVDITCKMH